MDSTSDKYKGLQWEPRWLPLMQCYSWTDWNRKSIGKGPNTKKLPQMWPCNLCTKILETYSSLKRHRNEMHFKDSWKHMCSQCERRFSRHQNLKEHIEKMHSKYDYDKGIMVTMSFEPNKIASPPQESTRPSESVPAPTEKILWQTSTQIPSKNPTGNRQVAQLGTSSHPIDQRDSQKPHPPPHQALPAQIKHWSDTASVQCQTRIWQQETRDGICPGTKLHYNGPSITEI